ncbi:helix-turn-helix transcriptional regulator, partial [Klebsiella pneumoniae]|uniref:helix-turn-helix transcriptional regulator n=1 Tax=Klebsiella pneumoniae TaxID=573 RepID=UPI003EE0FF31
PADDRSIEALADVVGLSRRTVTRRFTEATGMSFSAWRQRLRLFQAAEMLTTGTPVTTVALNLGYDSPSAFAA